MALLLDAVTVDKGTATTITFPVTCTGTATTGALWVIVQERFVSATTGVTYNGLPLTQKTYNDPGSNTVTQKVWELLLPPVGAHNVVVTLSATRNVTVTAISYTGVDQTTPTGTFQNTNGTGTAINDTYTSAASEVVVDSVVIMENTVGASTLTVGGGQTQRSNQEQVGGGNGLVSGVSTEPGAAPTTMSWTASASSTWAHTTFAIKAGSSDTTPPAGAAITAVESPLGTQIALSIVMPPDSDLSQYELRRLTGDYPASDRSNGTVVVAPTATTPSAQLSISDSGLTNGVRYFYRLFNEDTTGNWNTGATATEVAATVMTKVGWYTQAGTFKPAGDTGSNPIFEWIVDAADVEANKPVMFRVGIGTDNPGPNLEPTLIVQESLSSVGDGSFKYFTGGSWVMIPTDGVPWATVNAGPVTCRLYTFLAATQDLYASVRPEQA